MTSLTLDELTEKFRTAMEDGEPQIQPGDCFMIDEYIQLLRRLGYNADYENIHSDYGFIAEVRVNGALHALWQGGITQIDHSVLAVQRPLTEFDAKDHSTEVEQ